MNTCRRNARLPHIQHFNPDVYYELFHMVIPGDGIRQNCKKQARHNYGPIFFLFTYISTLIETPVFQFNKTNLINQEHSALKQTAVYIIETAKRGSYKKKCFGQVIRSCSPCDKRSSITHASTKIPTKTERLTRTILVIYARMT